MSNTEHAALRAEIDTAVDTVARTLLDVSHAIHERPELAFEEHFACEILANTLRNHALPVETGVFAADMQVESVNDGPFTLLLEHPMAAI